MAHFRSGESQSQRQVMEIRSKLFRVKITVEAYIALGQFFNTLIEITTINTLF